MQLGSIMKEMLILLLVVLSVTFAYACFQGVSNAVKLHYMCGLDIPWYAAYFLDPGQCPGYGQKIAPPKPAL